MESVNPNAGEYQAKDPVCGMMVDPQNAAGFCDYQGPTYFFCSVGCLNKFRDDPTHFLDTHRATPIESQSTSSKKTKAGEYACPMHPEVRVETGCLSKMRHGFGAGDRNRDKKEDRIHLSDASRNRA